jgi:hypothetical protein
MHSSDNKPTGVIQIINREHVLNKQEFMVSYSNKENPEDDRDDSQQHH